MLGEEGILNNGKGLNFPCARKKKRRGVEKAWGIIWSRSENEDRWSSFYWKKRGLESLLL